MEYRTLLETVQYFYRRLLSGPEGYLATAHLEAI